ncbi:MAG: hypothetical protein MPJ24_02090, partial [Pirellulaceae bacterium]|nr:hypothetical protein [Pirellulaceae bacterium]
MYDFSLIEYNGIRFPSENLSSPIYKISCSPNYDESGRSVKSVTYQIDLTSVLTNSNIVDLSEEISTIKKVLLEPNKTLLLSNIGYIFNFQDLGVPGFPSLQEKVVTHQVTPTFLDITPLGGHMAFQVDYKLEFTVSHTDLQLSNGDWISFSYQAEYEINAKGQTKRTITGTAQTVRRQDLSPGPITPDTADAVRDTLIITVPEKFRREKSTWKISKDKSSIHFTIIDEEVPSGSYLSSVVNAKMEMALSTSEDQNSVAHFSGFVETDPTLPRSVAVQRLLEYIQSKVGHLSSASGNLFLPKSMKISQDLFEHKASIEATYRSLYCLYDLIGNSGIWSPVSQDSPETWKSSVAHLWGNRGSEKLTPNKEDDLLIVLSENIVNSATIEDSTSSPPSGSHTFTLPQIIPTITEENSWLDFQTDLTIYRKENATTHTLSDEISYSSSTNSH